MTRSGFSGVVTALVVILFTSLAHAEILAMLNYESKPEQMTRKEGIAIIDVDPKSQTFGKMLMDIPLPPDLVAHHIYYNRDQSKAYVTALGKSLLYVLDLTRFPYRMKVVETPGCQALEDIVFSQDNRTWYLTCMGTSTVVIGDATTDKPQKTVSAPAPGPAFISYPHGISVHSGIDRVLITSTVRPKGSAIRKLNTIPTILPLSSLVAFTIVLGRPRRRVKHSRVSTPCVPSIS